MDERHAKYFLLLPTMVILVSIVVYPMIFALKASFFVWRLRGEPIFVGIENYKNLFAQDSFSNSLIKTAYFVVGAVALEFILGLILALIMNREMGKFRGVMRTLLTIPMFTAPIVVGVTWRMLYNPNFGAINWIFHSKGFAPTGSSVLALPAVIIADAWQWTPFMFIIFLAALQSVPQEIIEAAKVDGASYFQRLKSVVMPHLSYVMAIAVILRMMEAVKTFDLVYTLTFGGPGMASETVSFAMFKIAFNDFNIGMAVAFSWIVVIILGVITTLFLNYVQRKIGIV